MVVVLILYGSLYPWNFHARHFAVTPLWILVHAWPRGINRYVLWDVGVNLILYVPLGVAGYLAASRGARARFRIIAPLLLALVLSALVEMLQLYDLSRDCSALDVVSNVGGAAAGVALGALYRRKLEHMLDQRAAAVLLHPSGALLLLCCWTGYQIFPLFPAFGRTRLAAKLAAMGALSTISLSGTLLVISEWLAVACLLEALLAERLNRVLALLLLVLPARLFIVGRTLAWSEILGALAAYAFWLILPRPAVRRVAPVLMAAALVLSELSPFHFGRSSTFNWVPFRGFLEATWQNGMRIFFRKSFWYGSLIWLWRAYGYRLAPTTTVVAMALLILEAVQVYLPGRTPEITDAVIALLIGLLFRLLREPTRASQKA